MAKKHKLPKMYPAPPEEQMPPAYVINGYTVPCDIGFAGRFHVYTPAGFIYSSTARTLEEAIEIAKSAANIKSNTSCRGYEIHNLTKKK